MHRAQMVKLRAVAMETVADLMLCNHVRWVESIFPDVLAVPTNKTNF